MKRLVYIIISILLFGACSQNDVIESIDLKNASDSLIIVGINLTGEISIDESELTRTEAESTDLIGIQVYQNGSRFCYGLFDCLQDIKVALQAGYTYRFVCTMIKDGKNRLFYDRKYHYTGYPFELGTYNIENHCENRFNYSRSLGMNNLHSKGITPKTESWYDYEYYYQPIDRFYGEVTNYTPTVKGSVQIPLRRVSFGIKVNVSGVTDGSVNVKCYKDHHTFFENTGITNSAESSVVMYSMYNVLDAWQYADDDYQEPIKLSVKWTRGNGIVQDLGTKTVYVKRNVMNIIKVKLSTNDSDVDVDVDPEGGEMGNEDEDLSN